APDEYCDFADNQCGGNDANGVCTKRPQGCTAIYLPTCGCDGMVYGNLCAANSAGQDQDQLGGCLAPSGMFGCGPSFCNLGVEYWEEEVCERGGPDTFACRALPTTCGGAPDCACLSMVTCGPSCAMTADGGLLVTCPGG